MQASLNEATEARKKADERVKSLTSDARKHYDLRESVLQEEKRMLKAQVDDLTQKLRAEKAGRQVRSPVVLYARCVLCRVAPDST